MGLGLLDVGLIRLYPFRVRVLRKIHLAARTRRFPSLNPLIFLISVCLLSETKWGFRRKDQGFVRVQWGSGKGPQVGDGHGEPGEGEADFRERCGYV